MQQPTAAAPGGEFGSRRRAALAQALGGSLPHEQILQALWIWEDEFAERAPFALTEYVQRLSEFFNFGNGSDLLDKITSFVRLAPDQLGADPFEEMLFFRQSHNRGGLAAVPAQETTATTATATATEMAPQFTVFNALVGEFIRRVQRAGGSVPSMMAHIRAGAKNLSAGALAQLDPWLKSQGAQPIAGGLNTKDMSLVITGAYAWCCEEFGPSSADKILGACIRFADDLPEAMTFPPRSLL